jgi:CubicO group peptidase (beta-lactamase class C family)
VALLAALACLCACAEESIVEGALGAQLNAFLEEKTSEGLSGAVLVARDGKVVLAKGYGLADREGKIPCSANTVFDIGSLTKQFTAAGILKLEEEGKISTDDTLARFFPDAPEDKRSITLHQLLTHTGGFPEAIGDDYEEIRADDFVRRAFATPLLNAPGTTYRYSNVGYSLLGIIIERASGGSYEAYLHARFFAPLHMLSTGYVLPQFAAGQVAVGYKRETRWGTPREFAWDKDGPYWNLRANGGILSTIGDMYLWHHALNGTGALSEASKQKMFARHADEGGGGSSYGYGWSIFTTERGTNCITHNGSNGVFFAECFRFTEEQVFVIAMTNNAYRFPARMKALRDRLFR